jgi:hypothetical protein
VTVRGTGFDQSVIVTFSNDRVCAHRELVSSREINCTAPLNEAAGPVPITVEQGGEKRTLDNAFRYFYPDVTISAARWNAALTKPALVLAQDMNRDGFPDVVIAKEGGSELAVFLLNPPPARDGMITSRPGEVYLPNANRIARDLTTADLFRAAGYLPSLVYAFDQEVKIDSPAMPGQPLGTAGASFVAFQLSTSCPAMGCRIAAVGLPAPAGSTGDGLVVSENGQLTLYWMAGGSPASPLPQKRKISDLTVGAQPFSVLSITAADFTGDGKVDLVVSGSNEKVMAYRGIDAEPFFQFMGSYPAKPNTIASLSTDLDQDGRLDLVGLSSDMGNSLLPYFGGAMNLEPSALVVQLGGMSALGFSSGDWNGDGYPDLAFVESSAGSAGRFGLAAGSGERAAGRPVFRSTILQALSGGHPSIAMADYNNDGLADLLIPDADMGSVSIYVNTSGPPPRK